MGNSEVLKPAEPSRVSALMLVCGGGRISIDGADAFAPPTIFADVLKGASIARGEIFGRDLSIHSFDKYAALKTTWIKHQAMTSWQGHDGMGLMQNSFTLRQLEYLVAVGRFGSISLAADHLSVSPPSISNAIAQMEAGFGLPMFVRKHAQGMALTQSGRALMVQAAKVLDAAKGLSNLADLHRGTVRGELNVGCLLTFAQIVVPRLRKAYTQTYPEVVFRQFQNHQMGLIDGLRDASIDIALTYDLAIPTDLEFVQLAVLPPFAILSDAHPLASRTSLSIEELAPNPMILLDLPLSSAYFLSFFDKAGVTPRIVERTQDMAVLHSLVGNDFGYSIINIKPLTSTSPDGKKLCFVPLSGPVKPMRMGLLCARGAESSLTVKAFVDLCTKLLDQDVLSQFTVRASKP